MTTRTFLATTALLMLAVVGNAEDLRISSQELANLGVRFAMPLQATEVATAEATGRVVIPPAGDAVVGTPQSGLLTTLEVASAALAPRCSRGSESVQNERIL